MYKCIKQRTLFKALKKQFKWNKSYVIRDIKMLVSIVITTYK